MGIQLQELVWFVGSTRFRLEPDKLSIAAGETGAIVAGEREVADALVDVLVGLASPDYGSIMLNGQGVKNQLAGRRRVALVPLGGELLPHLSVRANISYPLGRGLPRMHRDRLAISYARQADVAGLLSHHPDALSPGERIRVALARALCAEPQAVVFEDRAPHPPCDAAAAAAALADVAVVVVTDAAGRVDADRTWKAVRIDET